MTQMQVLQAQVNGLVVALSSMLSLTLAATAVRAMAISVSSQVLLLPAARLISQFGLGMAREGGSMEFLPQTIPYGPESWLRGLKRELIRRTGRRDIEVTGGPYRGCDVRVSEGPKRQPVVDFYTPMRWDPHRVRQAVDFAVRLIENWEATLAEHEAEMRAVRSIFQRLQTMLPDLEMEYTVVYGDSHYVNARRNGEKIKVGFDLWPGMKERDIQELITNIEEVAAHLRDNPDLRMTGMNICRSRRNNG